MRKVIHCVTEVFFSHWQHDGETLLEFSFFEKVKSCSPDPISNANVIDRFVKTLSDNAFCQELKQLITRQPTASC